MFLLDASLLQGRFGYVGALPLLPRLSARRMGRSAETFWRCSGFIAVRLLDLVDEVASEAGALLDLSRARLDSFGYVRDVVQPFPCVGETARKRAPAATLRSGPAEWRVVRDHVCHAVKQVRGRLGHWTTAKAREGEPTGVNARIRQRDTAEPRQAASPRRAG